MTRVRQAMLLVGATAWIVVLCASGGCGGNGNGPEDAGTSYVNDSDGSGMFGVQPEGGGSFGNDGGIPAPCPGGGLDCYVPAGCTTSLSGTVYDPAGRNPLYNVVVFIPNDPYGALPPIKAGTNTCNTCDVSIGNYIAVTTTDAKGQFTLTGVPATSHVPLVVQTGKWRREVFLPPVMACTNTPVAAANSRLPKNHTEGDLPQMALLTGACDDLGCFMRSMGVDASEFTAPHGGGRIDIYQGTGVNGAAGGLFGGPAAFGNGAIGATLSSGKAGDCTGPNCPLWASKSSFEYYDIAILSCECGENNQTKPAAGMKALHDWLDEGGKVFASHYHYTWFKNNPNTDFQKVATWLGTSTASGGGNFDIDTSFPKGQTYRDWLQAAQALNANGTIKLASVATSVSTVNAPTTRWIYDPAGGDTKYLSFLTPIGGLAPVVGPAEAGAPATPPVEAGTDASSDATAEDARAEDARTEDAQTGPAQNEAGTEVTGPQYCGKAVFTDLHTSSNLFAQVGSIPSGCTGAALTPQQKALEYLFFDLSACVSVDTLMPPPPPPPTK
jgi:hypothetical protein